MIDLFTSQARVLFYFAEHPEHTQRQAADALGITERSIARIINLLKAHGLLTTERINEGARNRYILDPRKAREVMDPLSSHWHTLERWLEPSYPLTTGQIRL